MTKPCTSRILIVDDLPENLLALDALIRGDDRIIVQANSGERALAMLLEHDFALAILDVQMPGMNGFELAEFMRGTEKTRSIPIIFVTAAGREQNYAFKGYESARSASLWTCTSSVARCSRRARNCSAQCRCGMTSCPWSRTSCARR